MITGYVDVVTLCCTDKVSIVLILYNYVAIISHCMHIILLARAFIIVGIRATRGNNS